MLELLLLCAGTPQASYGTAPTVSAVTASQGSFGQCNKFGLIANATVLLSWSVNLHGGSGAGYSYTVKRNSTTIASGVSVLSTTATDMIASKQGSTIGNTFVSSYVYTVQVVRGDGTVTSSAVSGTWASRYGDCG